MAAFPRAPSSPRLPCDYSSVTRTPTHKWTAEDKTVLCILTGFYDATWADVTTIFNAFFRDLLPSSKGLSRGAIVSMYYQLRKDKYDSSGAWTSLRTAIESQANEIGIQLRDRAVLQESTLSKITDNDGKPIEKFLDLAQPSDAARNQNLRSKPIPRLAFRAYSAESQGINADHFVAGMFVGWELIPEPPSLRSHQYRSHAARHIARKHTGVTPFVSVSVNLIRCIHHALKNPTVASIACIDLHQVVGPTLDPEMSKVQWVDELLLDIDHFYKGKGELLVWGEIKKDAIIMRKSLHEILVSMPLIEGYKDPWNLKLFQAASTRTIRRGLLHLPLTYLTGKACGSLAQSFSVPRDALIAFIYQIVRDWRFDHWASFQDNHIFMDGVERGYGPNEDCLTDSFDGFLADIEDIFELDNCGLTINKHIEKPVEHSRIMQQLEKNYSAALQNLTGGFSPADEGTNNVQCNSKSKDKSLHSMQITQGPRVKIDSEPAGTQQKHTWKQISGYGSWVFAYT